MAVIAGICMFLAVLIAIIGMMNDARRERLVQEGKAAYFVRIAASGKGQVYHSYKCGTNVACIGLAIDDARSKGYRPCATCGGRGTIKMLDGSSC